MTVRLISHTMPAVDGVGSGPLELTGYIARVSNPSNQQSHDTVKGLLKYCYKHAHWSVFEHVFVTLEIKTTRDISRQLTRHRSFTFSEFSQRYAEVQQTALREPRMQDATNRQNSEPCTDERLRRWWMKQSQNLLSDAQKLYKKALDKGIAREQARVVLPEGMTCTTLYMTGSLRSWIHFCQLRSGNGTQRETQAIARECAVIINNLTEGVFEL